MKKYSVTIVADVESTIEVMAENAEKAEEFAHAAFDVNDFDHYKQDTYSLAEMEGDHKKCEKFYEVHVDYTRREIHYVKGINEGDALSTLHEHTLVYTMDLDDFTDVNVEREVTVKEYEEEMSRTNDD